MFKSLGVLLIVAGFISTIYGLIPVVFVYPYKYWDAVSQYWYFILFEDGNRLFWQLGLVGVLVGGFLWKKSG